MTTLALIQLIAAEGESNALTQNGPQCFADFVAICFAILSVPLAVQIAFGKASARGKSAPHTAHAENGRTRGAYREGTRAKAVGLAYLIFVRACVLRRSYQERFSSTANGQSCSRDSRRLEA
jgi:hypothetical protein